MNDNSDPVISVLIISVTKVSAKYGNSCNRRLYECNELPTSSVLTSIFGIDQRNLRFRSSHSLILLLFNIIMNEVTEAKEDDPPLTD